MRAFTRIRYGGPEVLRLEDIEKPKPRENEVLVKVMANSANPADWHILRGEPKIARITLGISRPKQKVVGADFSGVVEEVGSKVTSFKTGDRIFGEILMGGAFAEYTCAPENVCAKMPEGSHFPEMACVPIAGLTALQAIAVHAKIKPGETVIINGASGGVGHFAVQIAKALGAHVTGVCSSRNAGFVESLGAEKVIVYDKENIHQHTGKYDVVIDTNGNLSHEDYTRMGRRGVMVGFTTLGRMLSVSAKKAFSRFPLSQFTAHANTNDLETLARLVENGSVRPHIEATYSSDEIPRAIAYIERMRTRGKVAMVWANKRQPV